MIRELFLAISLVIAVTAAPTPISETEAEAFRSLRNGANSFAIKLLQNLASKKEGNLVVSPWSLTTALLMLHEGARGTSAAELRKALSLPQDIKVTRAAYTNILNAINYLMNNSTNELDIANAMFPDNGFSPSQEYVNVITKTYKGSVKQVDYAKAEEAARTINHWAEQNTRGLIKEVISKNSVSAATALVLANAVFFKGQWNSPFNAKLTTEENFYPKGYKNAPVKVQMMHQKDKFMFGNIPRMGCQALMLPYNNTKFYMLILLPYENSTIQNVISKFTTINDIFYEMDRMPVDVSLPRFKITSDLKLNEPLRELGVRNVFSTGADLSGISGAPNLKVSDVIQKAVLEVNEEGSKAAVVTGVIVGLKRPKSFKVDRPFISFILEKESDVILFSSAVVQA